MNGRREGGRGDARTLDSACSICAASSASVGASRIFANSAARGEISFSGVLVC